MHLPGGARALARDRKHGASRGGGAAPGPSPQKRTGRGAGHGERALHGSAAVVPAHNDVLHLQHCSTKGNGRLVRCSRRACDANKQPGRKPPQARQSAALGASPTPQHPAAAQRLAWRAAPAAGRARPARPACASARHPPFTAGSQNPSTAKPQCHPPFTAYSSVAMQFMSLRVARLPTLR